MSRFLKTPKTSDVAAECGGRLRAEGVSGERGAAERGGASDQLRARGRGGAGSAGARRRAAGTRAPCATRRFRQRPRQRRRLGRRTRGAQLAKRTHRAAWPYSRARGSAAAAASPRGPSDPPRGGSRSRRRRRGRARCSGRLGGEGSGGGVGRRARAPQRGRRVALPAPRQPLRGRRQSQTGVRGHGTGAPAVAPSTPADVFGTLMLPTGPLAASASSPAPAVTATGGVRGTCTGRWLQLPRAAGRPLPVPRAAARFSARTRASAADAFGAHAHARVPSQDDDDAYARSLCGGKPAWRGISASSLTSERQRHGRQLRQWCAHGRGRCQLAGRRWSCCTRRGCGGCKARRPKTIIRRRSECARPS